MIDILGHYQPGRHPTSLEPGGSVQSLLDSHRVKGRGFIDRYLLGIVGGGYEKSRQVAVKHTAQLAPQPPPHPLCLDHPRTQWPYVPEASKLSRLRLPDHSLLLGHRP